MSKQKFDFETIHQSKKWAFIDGALSALIIAAPAVVLYVQVLREDRRTLRAQLAESEKIIADHITPQS